MTHLFISYSHDDADFVTRLKQEIGNDEFEIWIDRERLNAGDDWRQGIDKAISEAFALIVILSPASDSSKYVTYEWSYALGLGKKVIPVLLKEVKVHPRLEALQYLNFKYLDNRPWEKLKEAILQAKNTPVIKTAHTVENNDPNYDLTFIVSDLQADKSETRRNAAKLLGQIGNQRIIPELIKALDDNNWSVREAAVESLGKIGDRTIFPHLLRRFHNDKSLNVRLAIAWSLGEIGEDTGVAPLVEFAIKSPRELRMGFACINALRKIASTDAIIGLIKIANTNFHVPLDIRKAAIQAIILTKDKWAILQLKDIKNEELQKFIVDELNRKENLNMLATHIYLEN